MLSSTQLHLPKVFKSFLFSRPLLFQTSEDIVNNPALGESLPHSVVLHHLFSRAPNELKSPHEVRTFIFQPYGLSFTQTSFEVSSLLRFISKGAKLISEGTN